jgi:hypothetical protein
MTDDDILYELDIDYPFPREALRAATERRAALAPRLIAEIDRCVANPKHPANRPNRLFFSIHLLAEWRETSAYRSLCALLRVPRSTLDEILGDALTETCPRVLASVFDGDPQPVYDLIMDESADEYARDAGFDALAILTALNALPLAGTERFLEEAFDRLQPREDNHVWFGWENAIAQLGLERLAPLVRRAYDADFLLSTGGDFAEFEEELRRAIADGGASLKGADRHNRLWDDTIAEMEGWHGFSAEARRERDADIDDEEEDEDLAAKIAEVRAALQRGKPQINPYRDVGRNDPCPCGSGQKFKRCHGKS